MTDKLARALDDLARRWVPDRRHGVWEIERGVTRNGGAALVGATTSRDGLRLLRELAAEHGLGCDVRRLPDEHLDADEECAIVTAALAPLVEEPRARGTVGSQVLHGEVLTVLERRAAWVRARGADERHGWIHLGFVGLGPGPWAEDWRGRATAISLGAEVRAEPGRFRLPFGARVSLRTDGRVELADGRVGHLSAGALRPESEFQAEARLLSPPEWALRYFQGAPYVWGGRTTWGVDCSGLVQATFAARGIPLPRDADQQACQGQDIPIDAAGEGEGYDRGDLLFFAEDGRRVSHVALWAGDGCLVHAAIARGGVGEDRLFGDGPTARRLLPALVGVRRVYS